MTHLVKLFFVSSRWLIVLVCLLSHSEVKAQLNLDNIDALKQRYIERDWFTADSLFNSQIRNVQDSVLKERLLLDWGTFMVEKNDFDWAEPPLLDAIELSKYNQTTETEAEAYFQLGELYYLLEIPLQAQQYYTDALELYESFPDSLGIGKCLDGLADNYNTLGDFESAMEYYFKADTIFQKVNASALRSNVLGNIGDVIIANGYPDSGLAYIEKALSIDFEIENFENRIDHTASLAFYYEKMGQMDLAYDHFIQANKLAQSAGLELSAGYTHQYLAYYHNRLENTDSAKIHMLKVIDIAEKTSNSQLMTSAANLLSEIYAKEGEYKKAYEFKKYYAEASDTLFSDQNILGMAYMKSKYAIAKTVAEKELVIRDAELVEVRLKNQKITNYFLGFASIIFLSAFGWVLYYAQQRRRINDQLRQDKKTIELQTQQLEEMDQYKSRFFANISHDFRSPLALIKGYVDILRKENNQLTEPSYEAINHINASVDRLNDMTDEIRDLVRLQEKSVRLKLVPIQVNAFFGMLGDMFSSAALSRGLKLNFQTEVGWDEMIHADKYALEKIVFNLIDNALKYNTVGEKIDFSILKSDKQIVLKVCDDGPGIKKDQLPLIFERYYQSQDESHGHIEGQGIGLSVVKQYVELHGGTISVTSTPGLETCFTFTLPHNLDKPLYEDQIVGNVLDRQLRKVLEKRKVALNYQFDDSDSKNQSVSSEEAKDRMILIVDDHPGIREYVSKILSDEYLVLEASNGDEARYILDTTSGVSLLITDLMMPKMSGQELIKQTHQSKQHADLPILVISANREMEEQYTRLSEKHLSYISKPFDAEELKDKVDLLLSVNS